jgi:polynucleotide 5'-hydroxyl-kinase GRC3/NOL9
VATGLSTIEPRAGDLQRPETLLIDGPASVRILSGEGIVLGAIIEEGEDIIVRKGKRLPLTPLSDRLRFEAKGMTDLKVIEGDSIPPSWRDAADTVISMGGRVIVLGGVDAGKTGFCTYLANGAVLEHANIGYVDGDIGQPEIGPPTTITAALTSEQSYTLTRLCPVSVYFVGHISPSSCPGRVIEAIARAVLGLEGKGAKLVIVNTDGWIGEGGLSHKAALMDRLRPKAAVSFLSFAEAKALVGELGEPHELLRVERPDHVRPRTQDERRENRERGYRSYFRDATRVRIELRRMKFTDTTNRPVVSIEQIPFEEPGGRASLAEISGDAGVILGLKRGGETLGLGILQDIDYGNEVIELLCPAAITPHIDGVDSIEFGGICLDASFRERYLAL